MNSTGQAYSVFKLLIAAIVALAILAILIPIITNIVIPGNDIQTVSKQMIQEMSPMPGALKTSDPVIFKTGSNLAPSALAGSSGLAGDQICVHKGDFEDNDALSIQGSTIMNNSISDIQVKVSVTCNASNQMIDSLEEMGLASDFDGDAGECSCPLDNSNASQKCCVVILKYA